MKPAEYVQLSAYARLHGGIMGAIWAASFMCFAFSRSYPLLSIAFDLSVFAIPFISSFMFQNYRKALPEGTVVSYRRAFGYLVMMFFHAILVFAVCQWAYFQFIDNGQLFGGMLETINSPEYKPVLDAYNLDKATLQGQIEELMHSRPIDFALSFMWMNMFLTTVMSAVVALFTRKK